MSKKEVLPLSFVDSVQMVDPAMSLGAAAFEYIPIGLEGSQPSSDMREFMIDVIRYQSPEHIPNIELFVQFREQLRSHAATLAEAYPDTVDSIGSRLAAWEWIIAEKTDTLMHQNFDIPNVQSATIRPRAVLSRRGGEVANIKNTLRWP